MSSRFQVEGSRFKVAWLQNSESLIPAHGGRRNFTRGCVEIGEMLLDLAHDTGSRHVEAVAPHSLRTVVYKHIGHSYAADLRLGEVIMCVVELNYRITEATWQRSFLDRYHTVEVVGDVSQQCLVYRLGEPRV